ncbi:unnamed protein product [Blepharisma stoltei]|uniref:CSD domain-containing protein n=1 Tax=Blepharisma stoltei TaxID=1481888 RepID=A0AAU9J7Y1_9CILI|nr:unnamed protein product [Blepharisma stoltei]
MSSMTRIDPQHSFSAPKKFSTHERPIFDFTNAKISPGASPSLFVVENIPIDHSSQKQPKNVFFNSAIPIPELKILGDIDQIDEESEEEPESLLSWEINRKRLDQWISKSCSGVPSDPVKFHEEMKKLKSQKLIDPMPLQLTPPPPGFENVVKLMSKDKIQEVKNTTKVNNMTATYNIKKIAKPEEEKKKFSWADLSSDSDFTPTPVSIIKKTEKTPVKSIEIEQAPIILKSPPQKVGLVKREKRGQFNEEEVTQGKFTGKLKFYQLKKRFGFITLDTDQADIFLCEDDLLLSGINHKKFKESIINKQPLSFRFHIKKYIENGKEKRKAIDIEVFDCKQ